MNNPQETGSVKFDALQETLSEYRFVYDRTITKKLIVTLSLIFITLILIYLLSDSNKAVGMFIVFILVESLLSLSYFFPSCITISQNGITRTGIRLPKRDNFPPLLKWSSVSKVQMAIFSIWKIQGRHLIFETCFAGFISRYSLPIDDYVGIGHSLSLEKALELFVGSIEVASEEEKEKIYGVRKGVKYAAFAMMGFMFLIAILMLSQAIYGFFH